MKRDEAAQMMLLTAVILLIGFVALAGMVSRVAQLADETVKESRSGSVLETSAVVEGINEIFSRLEVLVPPGEALQTADYVAAVDAALVHLDELQSARGYSFVATLGPCVNTGTTLDFLVTGHSSHADVRASFTVSYSIADADYADVLACP